MLAKTAGVKHLVVLINKMDDPTVGWSEERLVLMSPKYFPLVNLSIELSCCLHWDHILAVV